MWSLPGASEASAHQVPGPCLSHWTRREKEESQGHPLEVSACTARSNWDLLQHGGSWRRCVSLVSPFDWWVVTSDSMRGEEDVEKTKRREMERREKRERDGVIRGFIYP